MRVIADVRGHLEPARYPNLLRRYLAALIDGVIVILLIVLMGRLASYLGRDQGFALFLAAIAVALYEPFLTAFLFTVGQGVMRFRVRDLETGARVPLGRVYLRVVVKAVLGIVSFLTLPARRDRRAIHDLAAGTLVLEASDAK